MNVKDSLATTLEEIMVSTPIDQIRVVSLATKAGISKQTFYDHFKDKYDLMEYCYLKLYSQTLGRMSPRYPFTAACLDLYDLYREHKVFMSNGFRSTDTNNLVAIMNRILRECYVNLLAQFGVKDEGDISFALDFYVTGGIELTKQWALDGMKMSSEEIVSMWIKTIPKNLAPYFS